MKHSFKKDDAELDKLLMLYFKNQVSKALETCRKIDDIDFTEYISCHWGACMEYNVRNVDPYKVHFANQRIKFDESRNCCTITIPLNYGLLPFFSSKTITFVIAQSDDKKMYEVYKFCMGEVLEDISSEFNEIVPEDMTKIMDNAFSLIKKRES